MDENRLIILASRGDGDAFCEIYGKYKDRLYRYAYYRLGDSFAAEDAVSDCILEAYRGIGDLREPAAFPAWIFRILRRCVSRKLDEMIRQKNVIPFNSAGSVDLYASAGGGMNGSGGSGAGPEGGFVVNPKNLADGSAEDEETIARRLTVMEALEQLDDEDREIVLMATVLGQKSNEIAELTGLTPGSVRSRLSRDLSKLRELIGE